MLTQKVNLTPTHDTRPTRFYAVQGEANARELQMHLYTSSGTPVSVDGCKMYFYLTKPDRNVAVIECTQIAGQSNGVSCVLTYQAVTSPGICSGVLQLLSNNSDLRYDNIEVLVMPADISGLDSTTEFSAITKLLLDLENYNNLAGETQELIRSIEEILSQYTDKFREYSSGQCDTSCDEYKAGIMSDGTMLLMDSYYYAWQCSVFSIDHGKTWESCAFEPTDSTFVCEELIAGNKALALGTKYLSWGQLSNDKITWSAPASYSFAGLPSATSFTSFIGVKYLNGKYFAMPNAKEYSSPYIGQNLYYFEEDSSVPSRVTLPDNRMIATAVDYDSASGLYIVGGRYVRANPGDEYDHKTWVTVSTDMVGWSVVYDDYSTALQFKDIATIGGKAVLVPENSINTGSISVFTINVEDILEGNWVRKDIPIDTELASILGTASLYDELYIAYGGNKLIFTKDGEVFSECPVEHLGNSESSYGNICGAGRYILYVAGNQYATFHISLVGEDLIYNLNALQERYTALEANVTDMISQLQAAAGHKIITATKDPGTGSKLDSGNILFVYEEG